MGVKGLREMEKVNFNEGKILLYTILGLKYLFSDQIIWTRVDNVGRN